MLYSPKVIVTFFQVRIHSSRASVIELVA